MTGDTTTLRVSPWKNILEMTSLTTSCFSVGILKQLNTMPSTHSLLPTVVNLALIYCMKLININLPNAKICKHKRRDKKQRFFYNLMGTPQYQYIKCTCFSLRTLTFLPPVLWFAKERGINNPSGYWCFFSAELTTCESPGKFQPDLTNE